jgi:hypothetical protein
MPYTAYTLHQSPDLRPHFRRFHSRAWPDFLQDEELGAIFSLIYEKFPAFQFGLCDGAGRLMARIAARHGFSALVAPVRPTLKGRYPLTPMASYVAWRRPDGSPFHPWLRVHWRLGARVVRIARRAMNVTATVAEWEERTGLRFPASGRYVEPNVWMRHPVRRTVPSARR